MIKDLIKLANELDKIGLHEHSDKIDRKIRQLSKEAQTSEMMEPTSNLTWSQFGKDLLRAIPIVNIAPGLAESAYDIYQGRGVAESLTPHALKNVEYYMERKGPLLESAKKSLEENKNQVQSESGQLNENQIILNIKDKIETLNSMFYDYNGTWSMPAYWTKMKDLIPKLYKLSYSLGYKGVAKPTKESVGLGSVSDDLSSSTTSSFDLKFDFIEAGKWIQWNAILEGFEAGQKDNLSRISPAPSPAPPDPRPHVAPPPGVELIAIIHPINTVISGADAGGWKYIVTGKYSFNWTSPEGTKGSFAGKNYNAGRWNQAATVINGLNADSGTTTIDTPPRTPPISQTSSIENNIEIILSRVSVGANFSLETLQNEKGRLKELIEGGMTIPAIAKEIAMQHEVALKGTPLSVDKTEDVNKMSNSEMRNKYKKEIDLIMSTINRIFKSKK